MALMDDPRELERRMGFLEAGVAAPLATEHSYMPTLVGLCARPGCRRPAVDHIAKIGPPPIIEPKMRTGTLAGPETGPGRGPLSPKWMAWARIHNWRTP